MEKRACVQIVDFGGGVGFASFACGLLSLKHRILSQVIESLYFRFSLHVVF